VKRAGLATVAMGVTVALCAPSIAQAVSPVGGSVAASTEQFVRAQPTANSKAVGTYSKGARVLLACQVHGQNVGGNDLWYRLANRDGWMSARYVISSGRVGFCANGGGTGGGGAKGPKGDPGP